MLGREPLDAAFLDPVGEPAGAVADADHFHGDEADGGAGPEHEDGGEVVVGEVDQAEDGEEDPRKNAAPEGQPQDHGDGAGIDGGEGNEDAEDGLEAVEVVGGIGQAEQAEQHGGDEHERGVEQQVGAASGELLDFAPNEPEEEHAPEEPEGVALAEEIGIEGDVAEQAPDLAVPDLGGVDAEGVEDRAEVVIGDADGADDERGDVGDDEQGVCVERVPVHPEQRPVVSRLFVIEHSTGRLSARGRAV